MDTFFHLGLCISYDRALQIQSDIANGVCQCYEMEKVVCPPDMDHGLFTFVAVDNTDHNPSSATQRILFTELVYLSCNINYSHSMAVTVIGILLAL